ncbi:MAG: peroxidase [Alphaproteobacteria bacterium]|nr:peroxidase [Alphaproteobacteria bacterium]
MISAAKSPGASENRTGRFRFDNDNETREPPALSPLFSLSLKRSDVRPIDGGGFGSNPSEPGSVPRGTEVIRLTPATYDDGVSEPVSGRPSPRVISNQIFAQEGEIPNAAGISDLFWVWGQFIDHDITLVPRGPEAATIRVPEGDPVFDPDNTGTATFDTSRSRPLDGTGEDGIPRTYENLNTPFIDASLIYGSDPQTANSLRADNGYLRTSDGDLLPIDEDGSFMGGDARAAENAGLGALESVWFREHNYWVDQLREQHPDWSADRLYENARAIVTGEVQSITVNEFLPLLLGGDGIGPYKGFDPGVNPQVSLEFNTAAYRFGHSLLSPDLPRLEENGDVIPEGNLSLRDAFQGPANLIETGVDPLLRGLAASDSQELDEKIIDGVRNFLFGPPGEPGLDLASLNIFRGRDHGLPDFNDVRESLGLEPYKSFSELTDDPELAGELESAYGDIARLDLFVGGLIEDNQGDSLLGPTFHRIVDDQFTRIRDGDPWWYESTLAEDQIEAIEETRLSDVITRNTDIRGLQDNVLETAPRSDDGDPGYDSRDESDRSAVAEREDEEGLFGQGGNDTLFGSAGGDPPNEKGNRDSLPNSDGTERPGADTTDGDSPIRDFRFGGRSRIDFNDVFETEDRGALRDALGSFEARTGQPDRFGRGDFRFNRSEFVNDGPPDRLASFEDFRQLFSFSDSAA